jgi:hypothetical protein
MEVTERAGQLRRRLNARVGLPWIAGAVALCLSGAVQEATAQEDPGAVLEKLMREIQGTRVEVEACPAELEIYKFLGSTEHVSWEDREVGAWGDDLVIAVGVTNNGGRPAVFDYAIGSCKDHEVWAKAEGVQLKPGDKHVSGFRITHKELVGHAPANVATNQTCIAIFLLRDGAKDLFRDGNVPNHDKQHTVLVDQVIG